MKTQSVYLTVRVDIEVLDNVSYEEVEEMVSELDYNFSLPEDLTPSGKVVDMEICDINE